MKSVTNKDDSIRLRAHELKLRIQWEAAQKELFKQFGAIVYTASESHWCAFLLGQVFAKEQVMNDLDIATKSLLESPHD